MEVSDEQSPNPINQKETSGVMEIDHIFAMIHPSDRVLQTLMDLGLVVSYRRKHEGQGTANACFCFENLYLELLWIEDPVQTSSGSSRGLGLLDREKGSHSSLSPFGIAWRQGSRTSPDEFPAWVYRPSFLPENGIAVASESSLPGQPLMFESPSSFSPIDRCESERGAIQSKQGMRAVSSITISLPETAQPSDTLRHIAMQSTPSISIVSGQFHAIQLSFSKDQGVEQRSLTIAYRSNQPKVLVHAKNQVFGRKTEHTDVGIGTVGTSPIGLDRG
ncbi:VOC family protein [Qipengyuania sphaerica]|uniref:VOC family protein n=1 Tax=Qipengyuania sphaerica TaxID=2867243 RepID=UPI001C8AAFCC|nr:VOC family protein [Qipengyuania sphaerica]MBX7541994.1 VOC family protein [Qipengyuania sphaerica]